MMQPNIGVFALAFLSWSSMASANNVVFSDSFDSGSVAQWALSTNQVGNAGIIATPNSFVSPGFALQTYFDAPPAGTNLFTTATRSFNAPVEADYTLSLWARSENCQGCTISYRIFLDGIALDSRASPLSFEQRMYTLPGLTAGSHSLGLGVTSDVAFTGRFRASFDDVMVTTLAPIPEPAVGAMLLAGLGVLAGAVRRGRSTAQA